LGFARPDPNQVEAARLARAFCRDERRVDLAQRVGVCGELLLHLVRVRVRARVRIRARVRARARACAARVRASSPRHRH
jgi:hypothetical protein